MKSVLIIDKPKKCDDCKLCMDNACLVTETVINDVIPDDCPLLDLPDKQVCNEYNFENYTNGINIGWNRCLAEITGEEYIPPEYKE